MAEGIRSDFSAYERNHSWIVEVQEEFKNFEKERLKNTKIKSSNIYRVPATVREKHCDSYAPVMVSFGPYYHDHKSCMRTQNIKAGVLLYSLMRWNKTIIDYVKAFCEVVQDLKDEYDDLDSSWQQDDDAFLKLMIYDGCFFLEILHEARNLCDANSQDNNHGSDNPICNMGISPNELMECYRHDMLLLENQLPIRGLYDLFAVQTGKSIQTAQEELNKLMFGFIAPSSTNIAEKLFEQKQEYLNVLDLYRHSFLCEEYSSESNFLQKWVSFVNSSYGIPYPLFIICIPLMILYFLIFLLVVQPIAFIVKIIFLPFQLLLHLFATQPPKDIQFIIPSATEIAKAGIRLKMSNTKSLNDISFESQTLKLPPIRADNATHSRFANIIAFELLHPHAESEVTSYIYLMSRLLQNADDVRLLQLRGIIRTTLRNDEVVEFFESMTKGIEGDANILFVQKYREVGKSLTESSYIMMNNAWIKDLWQTYLKSPWAVISIVAAFLILALTGIQTVYTVSGRSS